MQETIAEDVRLGERRVFLHLGKRRYRCPGDGRIHTEQIAWIEIGARVTRQFAASVNRLTAITTNREAGWYLGLNDEKVDRIDKALLEELLEKRLIPTPRAGNISVDEVACKGKGRKAEVLDKYYESLR